jgi:hypothetical protein
LVPVARGTALRGAADAAVKIVGYLRYGAAEETVDCSCPRVTQMTDDSSKQPLIDWLSRKGHSPEEIEKILAQLQKYDREMNVDSVMDSIGQGTFNLQKIIDEALGMP